MGEKFKEVKLFITEDGSHSLQVPAMDETYHSSHGAIQESKHVFIRNGLKYWLETTKKKEVNIFEVGFGTGLNALLTLQQSEEINVKINYSSIELYPINSELSTQLNYANQINFSGNTFNKLHTSSWHKEVEINPTFTLHKTKKSFQEFTAPTTFDIIYYDAFAPSKQPEMWHFSLIEKCFNMLNPNGIFVTYSARGQLKRDLKQAGFTVESLQGPPGKFEMVRGEK